MSEKVDEGKSCTLPRPTEGCNLPTDYMSV